MRKEAILWSEAANKGVECFLCEHRCKIPNNSDGICGQRTNIEGVLYTCNYGDIVAANIDPIEKKPFYHFLPGSSSFSIAANGCNFQCGFCQNWSISQKRYALSDNSDTYVDPENVVAEAARSGCDSIAYTYSEPTIFFEYVLDTARIAKKHGLSNVLVTNGYMSKEALEESVDVVGAANIDLKYFAEDSYLKHCGGRLQPVLDTISRMVENGVWVEVTTLVIPGQNDTDVELKGIALFISELGKGIPWHISRFHPDHKYTDIEGTSLKTLEHVYKIGKDAGLKYVYMGNVMTGGDTCCPGCGKVIIKRSGFSLNGKGNTIHKGLCTFCGQAIEGVWSRD